MSFKFPNGKIIAFEGLDNCFKETNFKAFVKRLRSDDECDIYTESFPRYGNWSAIGVEKWLDGSLDRTHLKDYPVMVKSLYAIDQMSYWYESVHNGTRNIDILNNNDNYFCFVFDRYCISNALYNPFNMRISNFEDIHSYSEKETTVQDILCVCNDFGYPLPDIVVWMRMKDFNILKSLIAKKAGKDANELDTDFIYQVWKRSEKLLEDKVLENCGIEVVVVDCIDDNGNIKPKEKLADEVWNQIQNALNNMHI